MIKNDYTTTYDTIGNHRYRYRDDCHHHYVQEEII